ncbi:hypothetical protein HPB47_010087 [Ixodes persulcatus]|uniref:Uncharacterized protein n=1 Tax=Ixodes persulcatus TaxID=34615 RepID=A0AC60P020_IXOPE|nr:hypothetical protein HPB47_010087 [Ixodes persulcatus]
MSGQSAGSAQTSSMGSCGSGQVAALIPTGTVIQGLREGLRLAAAIQAPRSGSQAVVFHGGRCSWQVVILGQRRSSHEIVHFGNASSMLTPHGVSSARCGGKEHDGSP